METRVYDCYLSLFKEQMQTLNLPAYDFKIRNNGQNTEIFDCIRRKFVILTPEEWVRQHFVMFLSSAMGYPLSLMSVEKGLEVNTLRKRTDIIVHDRSGIPWMIVECKSPDVPVSADALHQASGYHQKLQSRFIVVTNGIRHICCEFTGERFEFLKELPQYPAKS